MATDGHWQKENSHSKAGLGFICLCGSDVEFPEKNTHPELFYVRLDPCLYVCHKCNAVWRVDESYCVQLVGLYQEKKGEATK